MIVLELNQRKKFRKPDENEQTLKETMPQKVYLYQVIVEGVTQYDDFYYSFTTT